jgi:biotin carboxyl carrier protein
MPTYEVYVNGKPHKTELTKIGERTFTVRIDDKTHKIEVETDRPSSEQFSIEIDGKTYRVTLPKIEREKPFQVGVDETQFRAEVKAPAKRQEATSFEPAATAVARKPTTNKQTVEGAITAPMTGKIVSVRVKKGDQVKPKQVLCVIEAMKMENEITSPKAGTVQEVHVSNGSPVSEGEPLLVIA